MSWISLSTRRRIIACGVVAGFLVGLTHDREHPANLTCIGEKVDATVVGAA